MPEKFISEILENKEIDENVRHLVLSIPKNFKFIPGQYISIIKEIEGKKIRRPYSICSPPSQKDKIDLCIKVVKKGIFTPLINKIKCGDKIEVLGPLGEFTISKESKNKDIIFISTGTGIGPFRAMIPSLLESGFNKNITLIAGYKNNKLYDNEFTSLSQKYSNFNYKTAISIEGKRVTDILPINKEADYYICGLNEMISSVRNILVKNGIEMKNIFSEKYD